MFIQNESTYIFPIPRVFYQILFLRLPRTLKYKNVVHLILNNESNKIRYNKIKAK